MRLSRIFWVLIFSLQCFQTTKQRADGTSVQDAPVLSGDNMQRMKRAYRDSLMDYNYNQYHPMDQIYHWMDLMKDEHSNVVSQHLLGMTSEKRPMYYLKIAQQSTKPKKIIWMDCGIHAREWIAPACCQWFTKEILQNYKTDPRMRCILQNIEFNILPVYNIDGYVYTWTTDRLWRKSRSLSLVENCTCVGTDLNRNFEAQWCTVGGSYNCCSTMFCGFGPASEPETKAVSDFLKRRKSDILGYFSIHSYGQQILTPYGYTSEPPTNNEELIQTAQKAAMAIKEKHGMDYKAGPCYSVLYEMAGSSLDYARDIGIEFSYIFELRDNGTNKFVLPEEEIQPTCEETMAGVMAIVEHINDKYYSNSAPAAGVLWPVQLSRTGLLSKVLITVWAMGFSSVL
ncbi:carboxypeptidase O-like [Protopterus annectens]|uniref:carboxypeptidase O-like n=1 Tax=Protopterus annectens TaxID=7888 RepID=UPI001CFB8335|nr:carboxypeptidase O-like [Protopterus annectens]